VPTEFQEATTPVSTRDPLALPPALREGGRSTAVELLRRYFGPVVAEGFPGAHFERLGGGGDRPAVAHVVTAEDLVAVGLLDVVVPPRAALAILEDRRAELSALLADIPTGTDLAAVDPAQITPEWPAWRMWELLHSLDGMDAAVAGTLVARKRPRLVPVLDSRVEDLLMPTETLWVSLAKALRADDGALQARLLSVREAAGVGRDISALRVFVIVAWMVAAGYADGEWSRAQ
jgi:hypothetical protein